MTGRALSRVRNKGAEMELVRVGEYERFLGVLRSADAETVDLDTGTDSEWAARREAITTRETDEQEAGTHAKATPASRTTLPRRILPLVAAAAGVTLAAGASEVVFQIVGCVLVVCAFVSVVLSGGVNVTVAGKTRPPQGFCGVTDFGKVIAAALTGSAVAAAASLTQCLRH